MSNAADALGSLRLAIERRGWRFSLIPAQHVAEVRETIEEAHRSGEFDASFYEVELEPRFTWEPPEDFEDARSVVVVSQPAPVYRATFVRYGKPNALTIPPTYLRFMQNNQDMLDVVEDALAPAGFRIAYARLPQKTLAARSGLARWGRNNISYVDGMGSFAQHVVGWTDLPVIEDVWGEPRTLARCDRCEACLVACPTGAIGRHRFLLHGEHCITHLNEWEGEWPGWLDPSAHNALVGCMLCQTSCPENRDVLSFVADSGIAFDDEETDLLLADTPYEELPPDTAAKVDRLDILIEYPLVCRNLRALLAHVS